MKTRIYSITLLLLITGFSSYGQDLIEGFNKNSKTGLVEFKIDKSSNKSKKELMHLAFNWFISYKNDINFKKAKEEFSNSEIVNWKDEDNTYNILTTESFNTKAGGIAYTITYSVKCEIKDKSFRFTINNIKYKHTVKKANNSKCYNVFTPIEKEDAGCGGFNSNYSKIQEFTLQQISMTIKSIQQYMSFLTDLY